MTRAVAAESREEAERVEFETRVNAAADRLFEGLERARSKMTPEERERAIRNSEAILKNATDAVAHRRKRA